MLLIENFIRSFGQNFKEFYKIHDNSKQNINFTFFNRNILKIVAFTK